MSFRTLRAVFGRAFALLCTAVFAAFIEPRLSAADTPAPPASALSGLVRKLTEKRAAEAAPAKLTKEQLLRPEFRFVPVRPWLVLPDLARQLTTNDTEREVIFTLLDQGAIEARKLLAAEGAEDDVAAVTTLFLSALWGVVREQDVPEAHTDALHAQIVGALAGPEIGQMSDADKQRFWEFCLGLQVFVLGMKEVATEPEAQRDLRTIAATVFESVIGVNPQLVDLGPQGLVVRAGVEEAARQLQAEATTVVRAPAAAPSEPAAVPVPAGGPGITYTPPPGWTREDAGWATIHRGTLRAVRDDGQPFPNDTTNHQAAIFVLPPRALTTNVHTTFDATWREQFAAFELGDTIVHYRARLRSGIAIYYMGRYFQRKNAPEGALKEYGVLYLVDLGDGRVQPVTALATPDPSGTDMKSFKESGAFRALSFPLYAMLETMRLPGGVVPKLTGGFFAAAELQGNWGESSRGYGGSYVNTATGMSAGVATHSSTGAMRLGADGTYDYSLVYAASNPQFGTAAGSTKHSGRYRLDGDVILLEPSKPLDSPFSACAVGVGTRQTPAGVKRILVTVGARLDGTYRSPPVVANWDGYDGTMNWFVEK